MVRPDKRSGGRVTPRKTTTGPAPAGDAGTPEPASTGARRVSREPVRVSTGSAGWLPYVMFALLAAGVIVILLNYLGTWPGSPSNWYLLGGLAAVLGGIIAATQYR